MALNTKEDIERAISSIDQRFKESRTDMISAIEEQRLYDIVGNDKVFLDIKTGLLWSELCYMPEEQFSLSQGKSKVWELELGFEKFRIPKFTEFKELIQSGYLDNQDETDSFLIDIKPRSLRSIKYVGIPDFSKSGYLLPCSDILFEKTQFKKTEYYKTMKSNSYKRFELAYTLITNNQLLIKFSDAKLNKIYKDYFVKKPSLEYKMKKMNDKEKASTNENKDLPSPNSIKIEELNYKSLISAYDISTINASLYDYAVNAEKLCRSLCTKISSFESKNAKLFADINKCNAFFKKEYKNDTSLTDEENALFKKAYDIIRYYYDIGLEYKKGLLEKNAKEFVGLKKRLSKAAVCKDNITELGQIEAELRPSFTLYTQMMVDAVNSSYSKVSLFIRKKDIITCFADAYISRYKLYIDSVTKWRSKFIKENEKGRIPRDIAEKWTDDLRYELFEQLRVFVDMVEHFLSVNPMNNILGAIDFEEDTYQKIKDNGIHKGISKAINNMISNLSCKELCDILSNHTAAIRDFYTNKRKDIYIRNAINANGNKRLLLDKLDTEKELYEVSGDLRRSICELLSNTSEKDSKFIANCFGNLCNTPLIELSSLELNSEIKHISSETYKKLDDLRKNTYELLLSDAKLYVAEQEKRESAINALFYEMSLDLEKKLY